MTDKAPAREKPSMATAEAVEAALVALAALAGGRPVREDFAEEGRLHVDRPLPFLCVHLTEGRAQPAARGVASANAAYLVAPDAEAALPLVERIGAAMTARFGAFLLLDVGELERDRFLSEDAPFLPPFEITLSVTDGPQASAALDAFTAGIEGVEVKFRTPRIAAGAAADDPHARLAALAPALACMTVRFAPIYRVPESGDTYPELQERVVANIFDAGLRAVAAFMEVAGGPELPTHRAFGRRAFVDAVDRADRFIDEVASSFDFLLAVTPINAGAAWREFEAGDFGRAPRFLYRPLAVKPDAEKRKLFSIPLDHFEDPVLFDLYREKQEELDLQLSMLLARETPRFVEIGRALYGAVEPALLSAAKTILAETRAMSDSSGGPDAVVDGVDLVRKAKAMIGAYRRADPAFEASVELREDLPPGMMVVNDRLLVARDTAMSRRRVEALLSHEIGVHLVTWFNGAAQGLRLFRSGLAGYEGMQEGLAVFAEYVAGGMTAARLRLVAARVVACEAMLGGASFVDTFRLLVRDHGFAAATAFNIALRVYRGGGFPKDAIYLRGLLAVLDHLRGGGSLEPFWMGKIAASHFAVMQELGLRGLLKPPRTRPAFLSRPQAGARLERARAGLSPVAMISG